MDAGDVAGAVEALSVPVSREMTFCLGERLLELEGVLRRSNREESENMRRVDMRPRMRRHRVGEGGLNIELPAL